MNHTLMALLVGGTSFYGQLGSNVRFGQVASEDGTTVPSRSMMAYGADAAIGVQWYALVVGAQIDYAIWKQLARPSSVDDTNAQGRGYVAGPLLGASLGPVSILGRYDYLASYALDQNTASNAKISYAAPSGYGVQLLIKTWPLIYWGFDYASTQYTKVTSSDIGLATFRDGSRMNFTAYGLTLGLQI